MSEELALLNSKLQRAFQVLIFDLARMDTNRLFLKLIARIEASDSDVPGIIASR
jgi:hypothetical protein